MGHFSFGENWKEYVNHALRDPRHIESAIQSLEQYLPHGSYEGKVFIDVGCGSGIFSLGALRLGCRRVVSFDIDPKSVDAARIVKEQFSTFIPDASEWEIFRGNILDTSLVDRFRESGDIVYSWGVLHHTGNMYQAIENTVRLVRPGGYLVLAIYNRAPSSRFWQRFKAFYNMIPKPLQKIIVSIVYLYTIFRRIGGVLKKKMKGENTIPILSRERGMSVFYDVADWLGGYPYEYASFEEIKKFVETFGLVLVKAPTRLPPPPQTFLNSFSFSWTGNNEFIFQKKKHM